jgi:hypothetical protein
MTATVKNTCEPHHLLTTTGYSKILHPGQITLRVMMFGMAVRTKQNAFFCLSLYDLPLSIG